MREIFLSLLFILLCHNVLSQPIRLIKKTDSSKTKTIRLDKRITIKTFDGEKYKGECRVIDEESVLVQEREVKKDNIMTISGFALSHSSDRALGIGLTVVSGLLFPVGVYYMLGGIAWGFPNGIFVGATLLAFDLLLAYAGTTMMGIIPRSFSTLNWDIVLSPQLVVIQLPEPVD